jgi:hypothetical protein
MRCPVNTEREPRCRHTNAQAKLYLSEIVPDQWLFVVIFNLGNRQVQRTNGRCFGIGIGQLGLNLGNRQVQRTNGRCFRYRNRYKATGAQPRQPPGPEDQRAVLRYRNRTTALEPTHWRRKSNGKQVVILNLGNRQVQRTNGRCFGIGIGQYQVQCMT